MDDLFTPLSKLDFPNKYSITAECVNDVHRIINRNIIDMSYFSTSTPPKFFTYPADLIIINGKMSMWGVADTNYTVDEWLNNVHEKQAEPKSALPSDYVVIVHTTEQLDDFRNKMKGKFKLSKQSSCYSFPSLVVVADNQFYGWQNSLNHKSIKLEYAVWKYYNEINDTNSVR